MSIELTKRISGSCKIERWQNKVSICCYKNEGDITLLPRYRKQVYDIIKLIKNNCANSIDRYSRIDHRGRRYYKLAYMYKANYPDRTLRFYSNNILEEDFDDIIELLEGVEIDDKVSLDKKDLCNYNLFQLQTIFTSMKKRKRVKQENGKLFINLEV